MKTLGALGVICCVGLGLALPAQAASSTAAKIKPVTAPAKAKTSSTESFDGPVIGDVVHYKVKDEDTMVDLARSNDIGYVELLAANPGVDPWLPVKDSELVIPKMHIIPDAPRSGIVINLPEMRLFYYLKPHTRPLNFPIGIGREGLQTPLGQTFVRSKAHDFSWRPTPRMRAEDPSLPIEVGPGPDNPMGKYVMYLGWPEYGIHGTNKPYGIGRRSSSGCIRMYPEDVEHVWPLVPVGTTVTVVNEPIKAAWIGDQLYVEAHPTMGQADRLEQGSPGDPVDYEMSDQDMHYIMQAAGDYAAHLDWHRIRQIVHERRGYPIPVAKRPGAAPTPVQKAENQPPKSDSTDSDSKAAAPAPSSAEEKIDGTEEKNEAL